MVALCRDLRAHRAHRRERQQRIRHRRSQDLSTASGTGQLRTQHLHDTDIHSTVNLESTTRTSTPTRPSSSCTYHTFHTDIAHRLSGLGGVRIIAGRVALRVPRMPCAHRGLRQESVGHEHKHERVAQLLPPQLEANKGSRRGSGLGDVGCMRAKLSRSFRQVLTSARRAGKATHRTEGNPIDRGAMP